MDQAVGLFHHVNDEEKKIEDIAAGQRLFIEEYLPYQEKIGASSEELKHQILRLAVLSYVDEAEATKKKLSQQVETERFKNREIKNYAERLAIELQRFDPAHPLAEEVLVLLLENKMKLPQSTSKSRNRKP